MVCVHNYVDCEHAHYLRCTKCGTLKSTAPADPKTLYTDTYWTGHHSLPEEQVYNIDIHTEHGVTKSNYVLSRIRCRNRGAALEIGCFPGIFLKRLVEYGFSRVTGIDAIAIPPRLLAAYGVDVELVTGYFPEVAMDSGVYDLVCGADVFEHTADPVWFLAECFRVCAPGGQLLLVTPLVHDGVVDPRMVCPAEHVYIHSVENVKALVEAAGFTEVTFAQWTAGHDVISARKPDPGLP